MLLCSLGSRTGSRPAGVDQQVLVSIVCPHTTPCQAPPCSMGGLATPGQYPWPVAHVGMVPPGLPFSRTKGARPQALCAAGGSGMSVGQIAASSPSQLQAPGPATTLDSWSVCLLPDHLQFIRMSSFVQQILSLFPLFLPLI